MPVDRVPVHSIKRKNSVDVTASKVVIIREDFFHSGSMAGRMARTFAECKRRLWREDAFLSIDFREGQAAFAARSSDSIARMGRATSSALDYMCGPKGRAGGRGAVKGHTARDIARRC